MKSIITMPKLIKIKIESKTFIIIFNFSIFPSYFQYYFFLNVVMADNRESYDKLRNGHNIPLHLLFCIFSINLNAHVLLPTQASQTCNMGIHKRFESKLSHLFLSSLQNLLSMMHQQMPKLLYRQMVVS